MNVILHLAVDALRRARWQLMLPLFVAAQLWLAAGTGSVFSINVLMALSMAMAAGVQLSALETVAPREVRLLPIERDQIWRAAWCLSVLGPALFLGAAKAAGALISGVLTQRWAFDVVLLSAALDFAYAALMCAVLPMANVAQNDLLEGRRPNVVKLDLIVAAVLMLGFLLPAAFYRFLPTSWSGVSTGTIVFLAAGVVAAIVSYAVPPRVLPQLSSGTAKVSAAQPSGSRGWPEWPSITGLPRLVLKYWVTSLGIQAGVLAIAPGAMLLAFTAFFDPDTTWRSTLDDMGLLPFAGRGTGPAMTVLWFVIALPNNSLPRMLRHLRSMFDARRLVVLLAVIAAGGWIITWMLLAAFHVVATGTPVSTLQLPFLVCLIGIGCLIQATQMRWPNAGAFLLFLCAVTFMQIALVRTGWTLNAVYISVGVATLLIAASMNYMTLTGNRDVYAFRVRTSLTGAEMPE